jgi:non-ribosomal peptide synthetase component E (peptide arylation enzyme)
MGEKVCAFVVPRPGETIGFEEMVSFLKGKKIAPFKLPERLEIIDALFLVPGGNKVDKRALEALVAEKLKAEGRL